MSDATYFQSAFCQKVRSAAKAIRDAAALAKDVEREWQARGVDTPTRQAWFEEWAASADLPFTLEEFYAGAVAVLDLMAFVEGGAVATDDRGAKLIKVRQD